MTEKVLLVSPNCPGCQEIKDYLTKQNLSGKYRVLDITEKEGAHLAEKLGVNVFPNCAIVEETSEGRRARLCSDSEFKEILKG